MYICIGKAAQAHTLPKSWHLHSDQSSNKSGWTELSPVLLYVMGIGQQVGKENILVMKWLEINVVSLQFSVGAALGGMLQCRVPVEECTTGILV